jgi:hypothetical protein
MSILSVLTPPPSHRRLDAIRPSWVEMDVLFVRHGTKYQWVLCHDRVTFEKETYTDTFSDFCDIYARLWSRPQSDCRLLLDVKWDMDMNHEDSISVAVRKLGHLLALIATGDHPNNHNVYVQFSHIPMYEWAVTHFTSSLNIPVTLGFLPSHHAINALSAIMEMTTTTLPHFIMLNIETYSKEDLEDIKTECNLLALDIKYIEVE